MIRSVAMVSRLFGEDGSVRHRTTHGHVVDALGARIVAGEVVPGEALPPEPELAAQLGVSRGATREAVKALQAKGIVELRPRTGTRVRSREDWNFLDADVLRWQEQADRSRLIRNLTELRSVVEPEAAALAATRASATDLHDLEETYRAMASAEATQGHHGFTEADLSFHRALYRACHNELFVSLGRAIETALRTSIEVTGSLPRASSTSPLHRAVLDAILARDQDAARTAADQLIARAIHDLDTARLAPTMRSE